jgi:RNA polymerase sigma-70 factor, ECF subfamily
VLHAAGLSAIANPLIRHAYAPSATAAAGESAAHVPSYDYDYDYDAVLVTAIRAGDRTAEEHLYRRHAGPVLSLATRLLHSREDAMDVLQDSFVTAFEDLSQLREPAAFGPWIRRIAVRLVHRRFRKKKLLNLLGLGRRRPDEADVVSLDALADPTAVAPEARAELQWLDRRLRSVSDQERAAWLLRHVEGLALEEVAEACDCSLATVKRRIAAADLVVRTHFGQGEVNPA